MYAEKRQLNKRKIAYIVLAVLLLVLIASGSAYAYLKWSGGVNNDFSYESSVDPAVSETFNNVTKSNVKVDVGNTGYSVYVRVAVVATWTNSAGQVHAKVPEAGTDYSLNLSLTADGWFKGDDGYYYYAAPVESEGSTLVLITECKPLKAAPADGYKLNVDIVAQTIQSAGTTDSGNVPLVTKAWGVTVGADGNLTN